MIDVEKTGARIYELLEEKFGDTKTAAKKLHVTPQAVCKWRYGRSLPGIDNLTAIAEMIGCKIDDLIVRR